MGFKWPAKGWPNRGDKVRFLDANGYTHELMGARKLLTYNQILTIEKVEIGGWSSTYEFQELPGQRFNSVMFAWPLEPETITLASWDSTDILPVTQEMEIPGHWEDNCFIFDEPVKLEGQKVYKVLVDPEESKPVNGQYYWVKPFTTDHEWEPAIFDESSWWLTGGDTPVEVAEIGPMLIPPEPK